MTRFYVEEEVIAAVPRLTAPVLARYVEARLIWPVQSERGPVYRRVDIARLELLTDLTEGMDLSEDALEIVMRLIDQLHAARADLRSVLAAIASQPREVRETLGAAVRPKREG